VLLCDVIRDLPPKGGSYKSSFITSHLSWPTPSLMRDTIIDDRDHH
jgi:hypothetical protein